MDIDLFLYLSSSESEDEVNVQIIRRQLRDKSDPLSLPGKHFKQRYRLTKDAFRYVLDELNLSDHLSTSVPPVLQLAATLTLLGSGSFQHNVGDDFMLGMGQSTICKTVQRVATEIERSLCPKFIKFSPDDSATCKESFMTKFKIPGVIGCVDGTHFGLQRPKENEHVFFNRKGYHSLNSMIICNHEYEILAISSQYGAAAHDSFVWKHSPERDMLEDMFANNSKNQWLLGDAGYPLEPWCIIPYRNAQENTTEAYFNEVHSKARCVVERTIGVMKGRWKILCNDKRSRYSPQKVALFSNVCAALHNICIQFKVPLYLSVQSEPESDSVELDTGDETQLTKIGKKIRHQIKVAITSQTDDID